MLNRQCGISALPLGSECNKRWWVTERFGTKIEDYNRNIWCHDQSLTLECKDKGIY